jgi:transglutaminase-like putative cysteine protease
MQRTVTSRIELNVSGRSDMIFSIVAANDKALTSEVLSFALDGEEIQAQELADRHGTRLHRLISGPGTLVVEYAATVGSEQAASEQAIHEQAASDPAIGERGIAVGDGSDSLDEILYLRPSRYCESDIILPTARAEFSGLRGHELLQAVTEWVATNLRYVSGSSTSSHSAVNTLLARRGVCRDFAHVVIAFLRAMDVPARMVAVYAPGLTPMDFHAVVEARVDGQWWLLDATRLAPRASMVRIATGRDASDIAFLSNYWANVSVKKLTVTAVASELPLDDGVSPIQLR